MADLDEINLTLGKLCGTVEALNGKVGGMNSRMETQHKDITSRLKVVEDHVNTTKYIFHIVKAGAYTLFFVLAFRWGDIKTLWH